MLRHKKRDNASSKKSGNMSAMVLEQCWSNHYLLRIITGAFIGMVVLATGLGVHGTNNYAKLSVKFSLVQTFS